MSIQKRLLPLVHAVTRKLRPPTKNARLTLLERLPRPRGRVLFLGDSITEFGEWAEWFPGIPCLNRGVGGDSVDGVRKRVAWTVHAPKAISLLIGTNDLSGAGRSSEPREIADQLRALVGELQSAAPDALLLVNSVMPRDRMYSRAIEELNGRYRAIAADAGATYVDVWSVLADDAGCIKSEFSHDHLHLTGAGYHAWVELLRPHLMRAHERAPTP